MKIAICSDLHLEFGDLDLQNTENADVLILSGDIFVAKDIVDTELGFLKQTMAGERYIAFIQRCCERFPNVVYVMGNHEHYHGDFAKTAKIIRDTFGDLDNFHFLDTEWKIINGVLFFGGTLWTDMNKEDPLTMYHIRSLMNDYNIVKNSNKMISFKTYLPDPENPRQEKMVFKERASELSPVDTVEEHYRFRSNLTDALSGHPGLSTVVVGHHAPSKQSTHPRYASDVIMNGAYSSNLEQFILDHNQIKLWTHGHTHEPFDYMIGDTRIVCNPRGYVRHEQRANDFELKYVEI